MLVQLDEEIRRSAGDAPSGLVDELATLYREVALRQVDAYWWMDHASRAMGPVVQRLLTVEDKGRLAALRASR